MSHEIAVAREGEFGGRSTDVVIRFQGAAGAAIKASNNGMLAAKRLSAAEPQPIGRKGNGRKKLRRHKKNRARIGSSPYVLFEPFVAK
jgi:hypothetical protein